MSTGPISKLAPMAAVILILGVTLSGCLGSESAQEDKERPPEERLVHQGTYDRYVTGRAVLGYGGNSGMNCLSFRYGVDIVYGGNATATWTPDSPLSNELQLYVSAGRGTGMHVEGNSPLGLEIMEFIPDPEWGFQVFIQSVSPGLAVQQPVELGLQFHYQGAPTLEPIDAACGAG